MDLMNMLVTSQYLHSNSSGASTPTQEKTVDITENGTVEVVPDEGYALSKVVANVEVSSGGDDGSLVDAIIEGPADVNSSAGIVRPNAFYSCSTLTSVNLPAATNIGAYAFSACSNLTSVNLPTATEIGSSAFSNCSNLTSINLPAATNIGMYAFSNCSKLTSADFYETVSFGKNVFLNNSTFKQLILRSESCCSLDSTLGTTPFIYVPAALVESYKSATNWSNYAEQFRALEDYTVDGTITGELDETKI